MAPKKGICHHFQKGKCRYGDSCKFEHVKDRSAKKKVCEYFAEGRCRRGAACRWSHDADDVAEFKARPRDLEREAEQKSTERKLRDWRAKIPPADNLNPRKLGMDIGNFFKTASELAAGEPGTVQEVINQLASAGGMRRIAELLDQSWESLSEARLETIFGQFLLPFFEMLTHPGVIYSPLLEDRLTTICNYIYGSATQRAVNVFTAVVRHLFTLMADLEKDAVQEDVIKAFEHSIAVLTLVVRHNTPAQADEGLVPIVETLSALLEGPLSEANTFALNNTKRYFNELQKRLGLGQDLPTVGGKNASKGDAPTFQLAKDGPGQRSDEGIRHDNDSQDIREISILPTLQEIQSSRNEYLPAADPREWHLAGLEGLLDRNFRLLREDTVGQLRDAAKFELERLQHPRRHVDAQRKRQGARTNVYENAILADTAFDPHAGLEFAFSFDQPAHIRERSGKDRQDWWEGSKKLGADSLICLLGSDGTAIFFTVAQKPINTDSKDAELARMRGRLHKNYDLFSDRNRAYVVAQLVKKEDITYFVRRVVGNRKATYSIVEFVGVLLPAFAPTLQSMQSMSESLNLPFAEIIAPTSTPDDPDRDVEVPPPAYATRPNFAFDLSCLTDGEAEIRLTPGKRINETVHALQAHTTLDAGQAEAIVSSLSRRLALIQGPPGTGKSFSGLQLLRSLLANKATIGTAPILCVTFTNHALDQVLERSLDNGISQIIRIGGRSKSERLGKLNLRVVAKEEDLTKTEKEDRWKLKKIVDKESKDINYILAELERFGQQSRLKDYLAENFRHHHDELFDEVDEEGWRTARRGKGNSVQDWLSNGLQVQSEPRAIEELREVRLHAMSKRERERLYGHWVADIKHEVLDRLKRSLSAYNDAKTQLGLIRTEVDLRVLKQAAIVGVTTSGLARNIDLLRRTNAKILVTEEAGEVLEAHLLTALLPSVEHAILIGDHQQLRPHVQNYDLSAESRSGAQYALDISLFERLVQPNAMQAHPLPYSTLDVQRRMFPSISELVRRTIYPNLTDAPSVETYPQVSGLKHRLFWLDHDHPENLGGESQSTSRTNDFECDMVAALVSHLVKQGVYSAGDIAVLTPYLGQLRKIRNKLSASFEIVVNDRDQDELDLEDQESREVKVASQPTPRNQVARGTLLSALRVATVDNFQGEEAKVIVISLVRSNEKDNPGFLRTSNRINVLLSRAQHGMYILGNSRTMSTVQMWADVLKIFHDNDLIGPSLELCCPRHPNTPLSVSVPEDFVRVAPEAGCDLICNDRLPCGHKCVAKCHSELLHNAVYCLEPCNRPPRGCDVHTCPNPCGSACPPECSALVEGISVKPPGCDHVKTALPCYQVHNPYRIECDVQVTRTVKDCGHEVKVACHVDVNKPGYWCDAPCGSILEGCGHTCRKDCYKCRESGGGGQILIDHGRCKQVCGRNYTTCSHSCRSACHGEEGCPPCKAKCENRCAHSTCSRDCHESCVPCAESNCTTPGCTMPCAAPCNALPRSGRCKNTLSCGCRCPSVEAEACPDVAFCQNCGTEENKEQQADYLEFEPYSKINLDEEPCIFTPCGHIFTITSLDGIMDMNKYYEADPTTGEFVGIKASAEPFSSDELKACPACRKSLRDIARYGRIVRRALLDASVKKLTVWANRRHHELNQSVVSEQERLMKDLDTLKKPKQAVELAGPVADQLNSIRSLRSGHRYRTALKLHKDIQAFVTRLHREEQPYQRIQDLVETARRQNATSGSIPRFEFATSELQLREYVQAASLLLRCELVLFADVVNAQHKTPESPLKGALSVDFGANRARCEALVEESRAAVSVLQEAEAHVFWARFAALECGSLNWEDMQEGAVRANGFEELKREGFAHLREAEGVCGRLGGAGREVVEEIKEVRRMLDVGTSESEMRMVFKAMAGEFSGTGHWYRCQNGHPFTVGECGMPMELARCGCGAGIGGQSHRPTSGVQHAHDIEREFGGLNLGR